MVLLQRHHSHRRCIHLQHGPRGCSQLLQLAMLRHLACHSSQGCSMAPRSLLLHAPMQQASGGLLGAPAAHGAWVQRSHSGR